MPLAGTFDVLDFAEVLNLLARKSTTGRLQVRAGTVHASVLLTEGAATGAEGSAGSFGGSGRTWRTLLDDICFEAMRAGRGSFEFQPETELPTGGPPAKVSSVVSHAHRRLNEWHEVEKVISSFDVTPRLAEHLSIETLTLDQEQWQVLVALDARRNISALARRLNLDVIRVCKLLKPLVEGGAVVLEEPEGKLKSLPVVSISPLREQDAETGMVDVRTGSAESPIALPSSLPAAPLTVPPVAGDDDEDADEPDDGTSKRDAKAKNGRGRAKLGSLLRESSRTRSDRVAPSG
jgi:hypothetical protein